MSAQPSGSPVSSAKVPRISNVPADISSANRLSNTARYCASGSTAVTRAARQRRIRHDSPVPAPRSTTRGAAVPASSAVRYGREVRRGYNEKRLTLKASVRRPMSLL